MKAIRIQEPNTFDAKLGEIVESAPGRVFVLFFGTETPATGESWCPDCVIADPLVRKAINKVPDSTLVEVPVGDRTQWRGESGALFKNHPQLQLTAIPTLFEWTKTGPSKKLVETDITEESLTSFIQ